MNRLVLISKALLLGFSLYAQALEVQPVIDITPDKPEAIGDIKPLSRPPAEIKAADIKPIDLKITTSSSTRAEKTKKALDEMSQLEQVTYLKRKIDKLRKKSHKTNAKIHALENDIVALKQEMKDLKENFNVNNNNKSMKE